MHQHKPARQMTRTEIALVIVAAVTAVLAAVGLPHAADPLGATTGLVLIAGAAAVAARAVGWTVHLARRTRPAP